MNRYSLTGIIAVSFLFLLGDLDSSWARQCTKRNVDRAKAAVELLSNLQRNCRQGYNDAKNLIWKNCRGRYRRYNNRGAIGHIAAANRGQILLNRCRNSYDFRSAAPACNRRNLRELQDDLRLLRTVGRNCTRFTDYRTGKPRYWNCRGEHRRFELYFVRGIQQMISRTQRNIRRIQRCM